ncbi:hypothetical protein QOZ80_5AG0397510 [Eleusine coracana subsp. coracana]|nr:hypothetical protein QOZ80_5AG0397510 [Eleusine coracana subsp. coracana]
MLLGTSNTLKEGCLDDAKPPMDQSDLHASQSSSRSVEAQEEAASCYEETSKLLNVEEKKKQLPSSGELGKIAHDEDEHYGDLSKMTARNEHEQDSDKIGIPAIEDQKQGAGGYVQALLDMDDDTLSERITFHLNLWKFDSLYNCDDYPSLPPYDPKQLTEVYEQLTLYRIRAYHLPVDRQLAELDDENLKKCYPSTNPEYDDYQRLVLYNKGEYRDWDRYHSTLNTYEKDVAYVQYCEALVNEIKWNRIENVAKIQALKIGAGFPNVSLRLVFFAFNEHIWSILFDRSHYKRMDCVYFEIWKRVAKQKKNFREALLELQRENMFPLCTLDIEYELEDVPRRFYMKDDYDAYLAGIDEMASDDEARQAITEAVVKMIPKPKIYLDYVKLKADIAKDIWLIGKVTPQLRGDR